MPSYVESATWADAFEKWTRGTFADANEDTPFMAVILGLINRTRYLRNQLDARTLESGTKTMFCQAAAPTGWTQIVTDDADNRMLRVVKTAGAGKAGLHSPIINNVVPAHTHGFTTGGHSNGHAHSGWTGGQSASHVHYLTIPLDIEDTDRGGDSSLYSVDNKVSAMTSDASNDHQHYVTTGGPDSNHTHSGTTDNGSSATNWQPRYIDMILCRKD